MTLNAKMGSFVEATIVTNPILDLEAATTAANNSEYNF